LTILDRLLAAELLPALGLLHQVLEKEYEALNNYLNVSHDIKQELEGITLLGDTIDGLATRIRPSGLRDELGHKARNVQDLAARAARLLSRPTIGIAAREHKQSVKPYGDLVRPIVESYRSASERRRLHWLFRGRDQLGLLYLVNDDLHGVMENLMRNAVKYTFAGESIAVVFERVSAGGGMVHVASRSLSIDEDERARIFQGGYRGRHARSRKIEGDGRGLAISLERVTALGGALRHRADGDVNIFTVTIPRELFLP